MRESRVASSFTLRVLVFVVGLLLMAAPSLMADTVTMSLAVPNFIIPLNGQSGVLNVYQNPSDCIPGPCSVSTSGFNVLGSQAFTLAKNSTSTGNMTLNMFFSGSPIGDSGYVISSGQIQFTVTDLDFLADHVTPQITLYELAMISAVDGAPLATPINLQDYLPAGTTVTDDRTITLNPISLTPAMLSIASSSTPFILSMHLGASVTNTGNAVSLINTPEAVVPNMALTFNMDRGGGTLVSGNVPEPSSLLMLGTVLLLGTSLVVFRRFRTNRG